MPGSDSETVVGMDSNRSLLQHRLWLKEGIQDVPVFTGEDRGYSLAKFKHEFEKTVKWLGLTEEEKLYAVEKRIGGRAEKFFTLKAKAIKSIEDFFNVFNEEFSLEKDLAELTAEFWNFFQTPQMSVSTFFSVAREKAEVLVQAQNLPAEANKKSLESFLIPMLLRNIDPRMKRALNSKEFSSVDELERAAKLEEKGILAMQSTSPFYNSMQEQAYAISHTSKNEKLSETVQNLAEQVLKLTEKLEKFEGKENKDPSRTKRDITCYFCGMRGHTQNKCFKRMQNQESRHHSQQRNTQQRGRGRGNFHNSRGGYNQGQNFQNDRSLN